LKNNELHMIARDEDEECFLTLTAPNLETKLRNCK